MFNFDYITKEGIKIMTQVGHKFLNIPKEY